jgi:hypothetical protein
LFLAKCLPKIAGRESRRPSDLSPRAGRGTTLCLRSTR